MISSILQEYRVRHKLLQKDLAQQLDVATMTISRIESGKQITLSNAMVVKLNSLLDEDDFARLNPDDPQEAKLLAYHKGKIHIERKTNFVFGSEIIIDYLDSLVGSVGFDPDTHCDHLDHGRVYTRPWDGGDWLVSLCYSVDELSAKEENGYCRYIEETFQDILQRALGFICMNPEIKKLSFFVPEKFCGLIASLLRSVAPGLSVCDVSVIGYQNRPCHSPFSELEIFQNDREDGFFRMNTDLGKEAYIEWKKVLNCRISER